MIKAEFTEDLSVLYTENLYQWDTNQVLSVSGVDFGGVAPRFHFCNKKSSEALVIEAIVQSDNSLQVSIPNSLLMDRYDIIAYIYLNTGVTSKTIKSITIPIEPRLKPSEYVELSDENIIEILNIELEAKAIIDGLTASNFDVTAQYKRPNIVYYNLSSYMCISATEITGIFPNDTTRWVKLANGINIVSASINNDGMLTFTNEDGSSFSVELTSVEVEEVDFPASAFTEEEVTKLKTHVKNIGEKETVVSQFEVGLYAIQVAFYSKGNIVYYTTVMWSNDSRFYGNDLTGYLNKTQLPVVMDGKVIGYLEANLIGDYSQHTFDFKSTDDTFPYKTINLSFQLVMRY